MAVHGYINSSQVEETRQITQVQVNGSETSTTRITTDQIPQKEGSSTENNGDVQKKPEQIRIFFSDFAPESKNVIQF
jgi:hypothetical protein